MANDFTSWSSAIELPTLKRNKGTVGPAGPGALLHKNLETVEQASTPRASRQSALRPKWPVLPSHLLLRIIRFIPGLPVLPEIPAEHAHRSRTAQLWLLSRIIPTAAKKGDSKGPDDFTDLRSGRPTYREGAHDRPIDATNVRIAIELVWLTWGTMLQLFFAQHPIRMAVFVFGGVVEGVTSAAHIWSTSALFDLVQKSFTSEMVDRNEVIKVAGVVVAVEVFLAVHSHLSKGNETLVRQHLNRLFQRTYLRAQLSLSLPTLNYPFATAMMADAGVMAGLHYRTSLYGNQSTQEPFWILGSSILEIPQLLSRFGSETALLLSALQAGSSSFAWSSLFLMALSLSPAMIKFVKYWILSSRYTVQRSRASNEVSAKFREIGHLGQSGGYSQEIVLFGLADWVIGKWEYFRELLDQEMNETRENEGFFSSAMSLVEKTSNAAFYLVLALRIVPSTLSFAAIRRCQDCGRGLLRTASVCSRISGRIFQTIFYLAAFIEVMDLPEHPEKLLPANVLPHEGEYIDYETLRTPEQGMSIQAINMDFTYPGSKKPTLTNINLSIPAGTTLAVVGFNGSGKTTLVKALMGLYAHTRTLLINGVKSEDIDPKSLHKRTSCLFQDFSKFSLTLRENVGVGNVALMENDMEIEAAIERGDAMAIKEKVGLDGVLNRFGVPARAEEEEEHQITDDKQSDVRAAQAEKLVESEDKQQVAASLHSGDVKPRVPLATINVNSSLFVQVDTRTDSLATTTPVKTDTPTEAVSPASTSIPTTPESTKPPVDNKDKLTEKNKDKEKGASLSGGQWQRVALSRAFLRANEADLVVFDEPSSALDPKAEAELFQRIHGLAHQGGRKTTTIYISHRFATVKKADQIAFVENGTIIELGTHAQLMALEGRYHEFYTLQKEGFDDA